MKACGKIEHALGERLSSQKLEHLLSVEVKNNPESPIPLKQGKYLKL